jgi:valyl-tRNA synthetase
MGHAFGSTLQDVLVRWKRMQGFDALWLPGIDHAGIATQKVVERQLAKEGKDRWKLGRDAFLDRVWRLKEESGNTIVNQLKKLGGSFDWSRMRFTLEPQMNAAVRRGFVSLYRQGLVYRGDQIVYGCPRCLTAISDLEIRHREVEAKVYTIRLALAGSDRHVKVTTTRPETLLGAAALAVHPDDGRYQDIVGKKAIVPLVDREVPVVSDPMVEKTRTGVVPVCPAHDMKEFQMGQRHGLRPVSVFDLAGFMTKQAGGLAGMERFKARKELVVQLRSRRALERSGMERQRLGYCERCDGLVEPSLSMQWFVRSEPLARPAIEVLERERVRFVPEGWAEACIESLRHAEDWCISRQSWWGHPVPAWYCRETAEEHLVVSEREPPTCVTCRGTRLEPDPDVLDTWFSASLWPFSSLGWPDATTDFHRYYPTDLLVTGPEILLSWVSRMIMMGLRLTDEVPFRQVYITALVKDEHGQKMSKSKGNVVNPLKVLEQYGADTVRMALAASAEPGGDILLTPADLVGHHGFANRLWNASRHILAQCELTTTSFGGKADSLALPHRWILSRNSRTATRVSEAMGQLSVDQAASLLLQFIGDDFLSDYLDVVRLELSRGQTRKEILPVVLAVLDRSLRLLHPFMPFVTEEIWQRLPHQPGEDSITLAEFPHAEPGWEDDQAEEEMASLMSVVRAVRRVRSDYNIDPACGIQVTLKPVDSKMESLLSSHRGLVSGLAQIGDLKLGHDLPVSPGTAIERTGQVEVAVGLTGLLDRDVEIVRLSRDVFRIEKELEGLAKKLSNLDFMSKAVPEVVQAAQGRFAELQKRKQKIDESLKMLRHPA